MARPRTVRVMLSEFTKQNPEWNRFTVFDDDEWVEVRSLGSLPRSLRKEADDLVIDAQKLQHLPPDDPALEERGREIAARRQVLTSIERTMMVVDWRLKDEDGDPYPLPLWKIDEDGKYVVTVNPFESMDTNMERAVENAIYFAFQTEDEKKRHLGEGSDSVQPSEGNGVIPTLMPSS